MAFGKIPRFSPSFSLQEAVISARYLAQDGPNDEVVLDRAYELKLATAMSGTIQKGGHFHADGTFHAEDH